MTTRSENRLKNPSTWSLLIVTAGILVTSNAYAVTLSVSSATGAPGDTVEICVDLAAEGKEVAGIQTDVVWSSECAEINAGSCRPGDHDKPLHKKQLSDSRLKMLVLALDNVDPIPDGSRLFCCGFAIQGDAVAGNCPVTMQNASASDGKGNPIAVSPYSGAIIVKGTGRSGAEPDVGTARLPAAGAVGVPAPAPVAESASSAGRTGVVGGVPDQRPVVFVPTPAQLAQAPAEAEAEGGTSALGVREEAPIEPGMVPTNPAGKTEPPTPQATAERTESPVEATLTAAKSTATAAKIPTRTTRAATKTVRPTETDDDSACQISGGPHRPVATFVLLLAGFALGALRRWSHWKR